MSWSDIPPADSKPGDWVPIRTRTRRWQVNIFPARLGARLAGFETEWTYTVSSGRGFLTTERIHEFWSEVLKNPENGGVV